MASLLSSSAPAKKKASLGTRAANQPWVEKFRPQVLEDVVGNGETIKRLRAIALDGNLPNIILSGPPGTGKTTSISCLARALLGSAYKGAVLELNASDERGIDVVRNKIKMFAQQRVTLPPGRHKIIILDEADSMTAAAQQALRRTMELFSSTTRFALACNTSSKIIEPIQSRCAILRFTRLKDEEILERLMQVCDMEEVVKTNEGLQALIFTAEGDMRNALNNLQSTHAGFGVVNDENVFKVCDQPHPLVVKKIVAACQAGDVRSANSALEQLWNDGYSAIDIIGVFFRIVKYSDTVPEEVQLQYIRLIGYTHMRIADGLDTLLQLQGLCGRMCQVGQKAGP
jgi:replication factor C subunit 2/4